MSHHLTPDQAREHLATIRARTRDISRERAVRAGATAAFGVIMGLYLAAQDILADWGGHTVGTAVFAAAWLVTVWWLERVARTCRAGPRGGRGAGSWPPSCWT